MLQPIFQVKKGKKNVEKMEAIKKLEEIKRNTFSSLQELEEKISSVIPMDVIKLRGDEHICLRLESSYSPKVRYSIYFTTDLTLDRVKESR